MLDYADLIAINKFEKRGSADALRDVKKQVRRNRGLFDAPDEAIPVYPTVASRFQDPATDRFYDALIAHMNDKLSLAWRDGGAGPVRPHASEAPTVIIPPERQRYLSDVAATVRDYKEDVERLADRASRAYTLHGALVALGAAVPAGPQPIADPAALEPAPAAALAEAYNAALAELTPEARERLAGFDTLREAHATETYAYRVREREIRVDNYEQTLSHVKMPKVALPRLRDWGDRLRWVMLENAPGGYPFTAGLFPFKREEEEPTRMFAGEGSPERTNRRFHFIAAGQPAKRLSTAFDSVTLYGDDPHPRPDIYGKVGNSGVSICTLDDMKRLYSGFDLCAPTTSVSMTINGPAPVMLAFFLNTATDQQVERHLHGEGKWKAAHGHDGLGLGLLGLTGEAVVAPEVYAKIKQATLRVVRGTVQADILKEDQAQNTCIFSTEFALTMMGDIQAYFVEHDMANFYSVSVSGYHMAEAGANPITQVAFTLANGFTYVENYLSRGLPIDRFARNLSFFFSNGMEPEYAVIGRVARRIWAVALKERYGAGERAQKLKYHIQTSGRSLHAQEISFNDIRTTLQALYAIYDNCNSLHTNAYDEAITTPTTESVRRAIAIQLIINRELGLAKVMNPTQGSYVIEELTELVEEAILTEFDRLTERGGVLGAMETMYQRGKIQDESLHYEELKHTGAYPIVGVNTFLSEEGQEELAPDRLTRSSGEEKQRQIEGLEQFRNIHAAERDGALETLKSTARERGNLFATLMETVKNCSLGEISAALYQVGGQYRRNM
jgi:methylmalonyl-CoA mutase